MSNARAEELGVEIGVRVDELVSLAVPDDPVSQPIPPSVFIAGDAVRVTALVNRRTGPATSFPTIAPSPQSVGATAVVLEAPGTQDGGYVWALLKWDSDVVEAWSAESFFEKVAV